MVMDYIHEIIRRYFNNRYSKTLETKIQHWLCEDEQVEAKDEELFHCWNEVKANVGNWEMKDSWNRIACRLNFRKTRIIRSKYGYAAVSFLFCILVASVWFWRTGEAVSTQIIATGKGEFKTISLPDGSTVYLSSSSEIIYPKEFNDTVRCVDLKGEAWFDVIHIQNKPFIVKSGCLKTIVIGTVFNVKDYQEDGRATAYLRTGAIEIVPAESPQKYVLHPGEYFAYDKETREVHVSVGDPPYLSFRHFTLEEIKNTLEKKFNVSIELDGTSNEKYTLEFDSATTVWEVLKTLCVLDGNLSWEMADDNSCKNECTMKTKLFLTICGLFLILSCPLYSQHLDKAVYSVEGLFNTFEFLEVIKEQTGYRIAYKQSDLRDEKKVKLYYKNKPLDVVLKDALAKYGLSFVIYGNQIIIKKETPLSKGGG